MKYIAPLLLALSACVQSADIGQNNQPLLTTGLAIPPTTGTGATGVTSTTDSSGNVLWKGGDWDIPLPLVFGDSEGSVTVVVRDNGPTSADPSNVIAILESQTASGSGSDLTPICSASSNGSGSVQTLTLCAHTVATGETLLLRMRPLSGGVTPHTPIITSLVGVVQVLPAAQTPTFRTTKIRISAASARTNTDSPAAKFSSGTQWNVINPTRLYYPVPVATGDVVTGYTVWAGKFSSSTTLLRSRFTEVDSTITASGIGGNTIDKDTESSGASAPGSITLGASSMSVPVVDGKTYNISVDSTSGNVADFFVDAEVVVSRPI